MRRFPLVAIVVLLAMMTMAGWSVSATAEGNYLDKFKEGDFEGDHGTLSWNGPWVEVGENDGHTQGAVHVMGDSRCVADQCLHIHSQGLVLASVGAARFADTSVFTEAELCYEVNSVLLEVLPLGDTNLSVDITNNGGSSWTTVDILSVPDLFDNSTKRTISLDGFLSEGFGVRFTVDGLLDGEVFVDNVEVWGLLGAASTTTTTTAPTTTTSEHVTTTTEPRTTTTDEATSTTTSTTTSTITTTADRSPEGDEQTVVPPQDGGDPPVSDPGGIHFAKMGVQADYGARSFENDGMVAPEVLGLTVEYAMAVEVIAANWVWPVVLVLLVTVLGLSGLDRRRRTATT